jgi:hypothetical protein
MLNMVQTYGPAVGAALIFVRILRRTVLEGILLYSKDQDRRNRALMLLYRHLAELTDWVLTPASENQASTAASAIDKTEGLAELPSNRRSVSSGNTATLPAWSATSQKSAAQKT